MLIADDDPATHRFLKRLLESDTSLQIDDVSNGVEALDGILRHKYDLVMLDINMPVVDGLDTLKAIRRSAEHRHLPIVVMTGTTEEGRVQEILREGVCDYLAKPLKADVVRTRLWRVIRDLSRSRPRATSSVEIAPSGRVLLVDESPEFRTAFVKHLGGLWDILTVDSGAAALGHCAQARVLPAAVFVGPKTGLVDPPLLVKTLRESDRSRALPIVGLFPRAAVDEARASGLYDAVVVRSFAADALHESVRPLLRLRSAAQLLGSGSPLTDELARAVEQIFGIGYGLDVHRTTERPSTTQPADWITASVELHNEDLALDLSVLCRADCARRISRSRPGREALFLTGAQLVGTVAEVVNLLAARLESWLADTGVALATGDARTETSWSLTEPPLHSGQREWRFESPDGGIGLLVRAAALTDGLSNAPGLSRH